MLRRRHLLTTLQSDGVVVEALSYLLNDGFSVAADPISVPLADDSGSGDWDAVNGSPVIASGVLDLATNGDRLTASFSRSAGLTFCWYKNDTLDGNFLDAINATAALSLTNGAMYLASANVYMGFNSNQIILDVPQHNVNYAITCKSTGHYYWLHDSGTTWKLLYVDYTGATATVHAGHRAFSTNAHKRDNSRVAVLSSLADTTEILEDEGAGNVTATTTFTHSQNILVTFDLDTLPSAGSITFETHQVDANNYYEIDIASDGTLKVDKVIAGTPTNLVTTAASAVAGGEKIKFRVDYDLSRGWLVYDDTDISAGFTPDATLNGATTAKLTSLGTGGAISDVHFYRVNQTGTIASQLDQIKDGT